MVQKKSIIFFSIFILLISLLVSKYLEKIQQKGIPRFKNQKQIEIKENMDNLTPEGKTTSEGWAKKPIWTYRRDFIKSNSLFIKEWDNYVIFIEERNIWIVVSASDIGYGGRYSLSIIDINRKKYTQYDKNVLLPLGSMKLSNNPRTNHIIDFKNNNFKFYIKQEKNKKIIKIKCDDILVPGRNYKSLELDLNINMDDFVDSLNIQTSWKHNRNLFYLNEKNPGLLVNEGYYSLGNIEGKIKKRNKNVFVTLDWGRGVWAYINEWLWASANGISNGIKITFNLGYGFSDRSVATENAIFINDKINKINKVHITIPDNGKTLCSPKKPWSIESDDKKISALFYPYVDKLENTNIIIYKNQIHMIFGIFKGKINFDGIEYNFNGLSGFIEKASTHW